MIIDWLRAFYRKKDMPRVKCTYDHDWHMHPALGDCVHYLGITFWECAKCGAETHVFACEKCRAKYGDQTNEIKEQNAP